jgi:hypothetical protein
VGGTKKEEKVSRMTSSHKRRERERERERGKRKRENIIPT